jgi:uncharacterized protein YjiS (DUF1127 family)
MTKCSAASDANFRSLQASDPGSGVWQAVRRWYNRRRTMRVLRELDDRSLSDIGLTREDLALTFTSPIRDGEFYRFTGE